MDFFDSEPSKPLLTIAIPAYNRREKVRAQLFVCPLLNVA